MIKRAMCIISTYNEMERNLVDGAKAWFNEWIEIFMALIGLIIIYEKLLNSDLIVPLTRFQWLWFTIAILCILAPAFTHISTDINYMLIPIRSIDDIDA